VSPDGTQLIVTTNTSHCVHVWDLRLIRERLREMHLDWDLPPYPPASREKPPPLQLTIDLGRLTPATNAAAANLRLAVLQYSLALSVNPLNADAYYRRALALALLRQWRAALADCNRALLLHPAQVPAYYLRGSVRERLGQHRQALDDFREASRREPERAASRADLSRALDAEPPSGRALNGLAWRLAVAPPGRRVPGLAVLLAEKAVLLEPDNGNNKNTLALACYRLGQWQRAVDTLDAALRNQHGQANGHDLFILAMSYQRLDRPARARACYDQALRWTRAQKDLSPAHVHELAGFRKEAAALLGLQAP
jgi:tetratricopeptide (TPR) repeat protein